jgi:hypothetical protein
MTSITISDLLTIIFVLVDDWYQAEGVKLLKGYLFFTRMLGLGTAGVG